MKIWIETNLTVEEWKELIELAKKHFDDPNKKIIYREIAT